MARTKEELLEKLAEDVVEMEDEDVVVTAKEYLDAGYPAMEGLMNGLVKGMSKAGELFDAEEYFVTDVLLCSDAMYAGVDVFKPYLPKEGSGRKVPKAVIGVVEGDTHDIGKNLVKILMDTNGFEMFDLGRDVPLEQFVDKAEEVGADIIAMSTLMTTTMGGMRRVIEILKERGIRDKYTVMVGGSPISQKFADEIGADIYTANAVEAAEAAKRAVCLGEEREWQRRLRALKKEQVDRPPVVCPGGMMNMITTDLMEISGVRWPQAHTDAQMMAELAYANYQNGCFENVGLPFDMVAEAEQRGAQITLGSECIEPHVTGYAMSELADFRKLNPLDMTRGRIAVALQAIRILKERDPNIPIIGNITGPISTASSLMEPVKFYKALKKNPEEADAFLTFVTTQLIRFARAQIEAGADVISVADPSGTGEILGPKLFERYTGKYLNLF